MKVYAPIGYYHDPEDIYDLYPSSTFKGDEADIILNFQKHGLGNFHAIDGTPDAESYITPAEASKEKSIVFTSDGQYLVRFTGGSRKFLSQGNYMHGFYIDIYQLIDAPGYEYSGLLEEAPENEPDITSMSDDELENYAIGLIGKVKEVVIELERRDTRKSK